MTHLQVITGNIFNSKCQVLVNTVNCVGAMGAGIALECRLRYPALYREYVGLCAQQRIAVGQLWLFKSPQKWVLNFPTKKDWRNPSQEQYLQAGLERFLATYQTDGIESIAFPLLGAQNGGLDPARVLALMKGYLSQCEIPVEIYLHDTKTTDPVYQGLKTAFLTLAPAELAYRTKLRPAAAEAVKRALSMAGICQLGPLTKAPGLSVAMVASALLALETPEERIGAGSGQGDLGI